MMKRTVSLKFKRELEAEIKRLQAQERQKEASDLASIGNRIMGNGQQIGRLSNELLKLSAELKAARMPKRDPRQSLRLDNIIGDFHNAAAEIDKLAALVRETGIVIKGL